MKDHGKGRYVITLKGAGRPFSVYVTDTDDVSVSEHLVTIYSAISRTYYPWHRVDSVVFHRPLNHV